MSASFYDTTGSKSTYKRGVENGAPRCTIEKGAQCCHGATSLSLLELAWSSQCGGSDKGNQDHGETHRSGRVQKLKKRVLFV